MANNAFTSVKPAETRSITAVGEKPAESAAVIIALICKPTTPASGPWPVTSTIATAKPLGVRTTSHQSPAIAPLAGKVCPATSRPALETSIRVGESAFRIDATSGASCSRPCQAARAISICATRFCRIDSASAAAILISGGFATSMT